MPATRTPRPLASAWATHHPSARLRYDAAEAALREAAITLIEALRLSSVPRTRGECYGNPGPFHDIDTRAKRGRQQIALAQKICDRCPIKAECRALGEGEVDGMWGGVYRHRGRQVVVTDD